jgi:spore coat protein U-like protein
MLANSLKSVSSRIGVVVVALGVACAPAFASSATNTMGVSATVQATCLITTTPMSFGTYTGVVANATATLTLTCTSTTPYDVALDPGTATGATVTTRQMTGTSTSLNYALFSDSARTVNWGQTVGTDTVHGVGNGSNQPLTVYGQIAANQYVAPGNYSDTITATINY